MKPEQICGPVATHGESPVWSADWGGLRFVDLVAGDVVRLADDGVERWHVGTHACAIRPRHDGGIVLALERGFALAEGWGSPVTALGELWTDPGIRFNDGGCDPDGGFLCASVPYSFSGADGVMYRLHADRTVERLFAGLGVSNGLEWTAAGDAAYYTDSLTGRIDRFAYDRTRGLHERRPFAAVPDDAGYPDGLTVDVEGGVWVALWSGGAVHRYAPDGRLDAVVRVPVRGTTACTFGGANLDELFITTMRMDGDPEPAAGAVFRYTPGIRGVPARTFAG